MNIEQRITKAKIKLLSDNPFFGQLVCYLMAYQSELVPTAAIDKRGHVFYNKDWMKSLSDKELKTVLCHEILHLAFQHPWRMGSRDRVLFNIASDLKVNLELRGRDTQLPAGALKPEKHSSQFKLGRVIVKNIDKKTTEQIYEELDRKVPEWKVNITFGKGKGTGKGEREVKVDTSKLDKDWKDLVDKMTKDLIRANGAKKGKVDTKALQNQWRQRIESAKQAGKCPAGLKRELEALSYPEIPWFQVIRQRFKKMTRKLSWKRPSKKWLPFYFPGSKKDKGIKAVIAIDTSGSMTKGDLSKAISEIWGLSQSFKAFQLYILFNDAKVWDVIPVKNGNREKLKGLKPKGGGGTSFRPVFKLIEERWRGDIDCLIFFTDGYASDDWPKRPGYDVYWITRSDDVDWPFGKVIKLQDHD